MGPATMMLGGTRLGWIRVVRYTALGATATIPARLELLISRTANRTGTTIVDIPRRLRGTNPAGMPRHHLVGTPLVMMPAGDPA